MRVFMYAVVLVGAMGMGGGVVAAENNSSLAPLTPALTPQAAAPSAGAAPQPDYILKDCLQAESSGDSISPMNGVDPAGLLAVYLGNRDHRAIYSDSAVLASIRITLLEGPAHGELVPGTSDYAKSAYLYGPEPDYVGSDKAVFMAEFEGKLYKIVIDLHVFITVGENGESTTCPPPKLFKVNGKSVSGSSGYDLNTIPLTFADLFGGALGQTKSEKGPGSNHSSRVKS